MSRSIRPYLFPFVLYSLVCCRAFAWSWTDAEQQAIRSNLGLQVAKETMAIATLTKDSARSRRLPNLSMIGEARRYDDADGAAYQISGGVKMDLPVYAGGRIGYGVSSAAEKVSQATQSDHITKITVLRDLRSAFSWALYTKLLIELRKRIVDQRKQNLDFVKLRYDSGLEFQWVYLSSQAKFVQSKMNLLDAQMSESVALSTLESILGPLPIQSVAEIDENGFFTAKEDYTLDFLLRNITSHPEIMLQTSKIAEQELDIKIRKAEFLPTIGFRGTLLALDEDDQDVIPFWAVGAYLSMPLFEGGRNRRNLQIARLHRDQLNLETQQLTLSMRTQITRAHKDLLLAKERITVSRQNFEASRDRATVVTRQYRTGLIDFLHFERAQDDWVIAEEGMLRARLDYFISRTRLEAEIGRELGTS